MLYTPSGSSEGLTADAERMGGSIEAESTPGVGSAFLIKLPFEPARGQSDIAASDESPTGLNRDVRVVEDNHVNQQVIGQMLHSLGCRAHLVSGAMEGLRAPCEKRFDFVTAIDTPVLAVTANALAADEVRVRGLGFDD